MVYEFNRAPIAGSTFHSDRQGVKLASLGPSSPTKLEKNLETLSDCKKIGNIFFEYDVDN